MSQLGKPVVLVNVLFLVVVLVALLGALPVLMVVLAWLFGSRNLVVVGSMAVPGPGVLFGVRFLVAQAQQAYAEEEASARVCLVQRTKCLQAMFEQIWQSLVVNLTDSNFQELVARGESRLWVVKFYASVLMLAATWEQLAKKLDGQVNVAKVDCAESQFVANMFDVHGYPTLKLISQVWLFWTQKFGEFRAMGSTRSSRSRRGCVPL
ncbi:unnamed protein product [Symbiodinium natans]|uniref:Thioredoxin domain-containing protein n=1 Tax=Symbiodinium natans TaxID=878477 RepID=A0A812P902_9DINO|nr:unnamed protein product [Symbiodinium natans]